jgi:hypothetical protein
MIDEDAIIRNLHQISAQVAKIADEIAKCKRGEYSPFMSEERFEATINEALTAMGTTRAQACFGLDKPHHCSRCEAIVRAWMERRIKAD